LKHLKEECCYCIALHNSFTFKFMSHLSIFLRDVQVWNGVSVRLEWTLNFPCSLSTKS
jgi:hypothetical protein